MILVVDSSSWDDTRLLAKDMGADVVSIPQSEFNHGGTRQLAAEILNDCDIIVYLTQDAMLSAPDVLQRIVSVFDDKAVGVAYGRQLPHQDAGPIAAHARLFNYPDRSHSCSIADAPRLGLKTAFTSNSFAAYRREALMAVGGFPSDVILSEDMVVAARMLLSGWKVAYCAEAMVYHSHDYTLLQEFRRYFDIGVLHAREAWLLEKFGKPEGEGKRFVLSELAYLRKRAPWLIPSAVVRTVLKYLGYRLGRFERYLPSIIKPTLSMHRNYWGNQ
jgi:rhamnosyltransferase